MSSPLRKGLASVSMSSIAVEPLSSFRYILLVTRSLSVKESLAISAKFQNVVIADDTFMTSKNDLSQIQFDCLIVNLRSNVIATWYDEIREQVKVNEAFKVVAIYKKSFWSNLDILIAKLEPNSVVPVIPIDVADVERFLRKLLATKSPRVKTSFGCCVSAVEEQ